MDICNRIAILNLLSNLRPEKGGLMKMKRANPYAWIYPPRLQIQNRNHKIFETLLYLANFNLGLPDTLVNYYKNHVLSRLTAIS